MSTARDNALLEAYSITHILNMNDYEGEEDVYRYVCPHTTMYMYPDYTC